ncbi:aminotransferase class V-fold PLP-dependent enzyme [Pectobacterium odoriferum]|uniref:aminotransferase class V-fold PLP-dependent enzyme n=1 Tax=Pectobacterium odoriferum TaxID=78398 RepID=UPI00244E54AB|nr:pyridoxal-dependent decarboxylase [Pectobacterium odoriferum]
MFRLRHRSPPCHRDSGTTLTVKKALRVLGFGLRHLRIASVNAFGQIDVSQLPPLDDRTILCLQAGEVNTGEFDDFAQIIPIAKAAGAWVHVDGAFGLWARASSHAVLTDGIELADSWTTDAHKWLNPPTTARWRFAAMRTCWPRR